VGQLADAIAPFVPEGSAMLDLGCGDLAILNELRVQRSLRRCVGADVWALQSDVPAGCEYLTIQDGEPLPLRDAEFDTVIVVDVLHHSRDPRWLLSQALRVGRTVIVKDHFEYGAWSRLLLRFLDYLGNHAYGVNVPERYFTQESFGRLVSETLPGGSWQVMPGLNLYSHIPGASIFFPPKLQFLAVLTAEKRAAPDAG
jgi:SAM-dependent methyltransferase